MVKKLVFKFLINIMYVPSLDLLMQLLLQYKIQGLNQNRPSANVLMLYVNGTICQLNSSPLQCLSVTMKDATCIKRCKCPFPCPSINPLHIWFKCILKTLNILFVCIFPLFFKNNCFTKMRFVKR